MRKLLALLLAWSLPSITMASEDIVSLIGDRQYWETFQWDEAESSAIWTLDGWEQYTGKQDSNLPIVKERTVFLLEIDFTGRQIKENPPGKMPWGLALLSEKTSAEKCEHLVAWSAAQFGKPTALDTSYEIAFESSPESQVVDNVQKVYEWIVGSTRIRVLCAGMVPRVPLPDSYASVVTLISFTHQTNEEPLTPLFALKCAGTITALADSSTKELPPHTFIIDTYWGTVRNLRKVPIDKESSITSDGISFVMEGDNIVVDYRIDRLTGRYDAESRSKTTQTPQSRISGECAKVTDLGL